MKPKSPVFRTLDAYVYKKIAGELRVRLPGHVMIDVDRGKDEYGRSVVMLRCKQPEVAKKVLADILGEEYIEPEIEEDLPEKREEWWQRSIQMYFGGDNRGDSNEIRNEIESYRKRFQSDALRVRKRMFPSEKGGSTGSSSFSSNRSYAEERGSSGNYAKAFREDAERYAKAFHEDVENIRRRMFGGAGAKEREEPTIERHEEEEKAKGKEVKVIEKSRSRGRGEWWQRSMGYGNRGVWGLC